MNQTEDIIAGNHRAGVVTLVGRPNAGKSTLINTLIGLKVAATSPRAQTTRFPIKAVLNEERGQIVFVDTPGVFAKHHDALSKKISHLSEYAIQEEGDVVLYLIDVTRPRGIEENRIIGLIRTLDIPKILVFNKIDKKKNNYIFEYAFLKDEFDAVVEVSALEGTNINTLITEIFNYLPEQGPIIPQEELKTPLVNINRRMYIEEMIREKVFLFLRQEIPYSTTVKVNSIEDKGELVVIDADIVTSVDRYKGMIIGKEGKKIKQIGQTVRKDLETITHRKVFLNLDVVVDPHWIQEWL